MSIFCVGLASRGNIIGVALAIGFLSLVAPACPAPGTAQPQASAKALKHPPSCLAILAQPGVALLGTNSAKWNAGDVGPVRTAVLSHIFEVMNSSKQVVKITGLYGACGCTTGVLSGDRTLPAALAPGETVTIEADVDLSDVISGPMDEMLWVVVSSQAWPAATIEVVGTVAPALPSDPQSTRTTRS